ncbi:dihydrolipoyl dehydrogenase [Candidatus Gracilibacteria bacterium]|nr:dihydrolipoyl dehydrogenase [Candidatus Gracilibacteria bacterium]
MKTYDLIIIGSGGGSKLRPAGDLGKKVAIIEKDDLGGTCLNRGCIPSKMLIHTAEVADEIRNAHKYDIDNDTNFKVNFEELTTRVTESVSKTSHSIGDYYEKHKNVDYYHGTAKFIENKVIEINGEQLTAEKIFISVGTRARIPEIEGLRDTPFMTSTEALRLRKQPKKLLVLGGGYVAAELGYFYGAVGTEVEFIVRSTMLKGEDGEIAEEFTKVFGERFKLHLGHSPTKIQYENDEFIVTSEDKEGNTHELRADALLNATGIVPNTDTLDLENTDIALNARGYIIVDDNLQTNIPGIYALGDCLGRYFFRHSVNFEGEYLMRTLYTKPSKEKIDYPPMPHAVFSNPQIAGVGKTEEELKEEGIHYIVGKNPYSKSAMGGDAWMSEHGFCKLLFDRVSRKLLGAHIIGKESSNMIHGLIMAMTMEATLDDLLKMIYIHPALPEVVRNAARNARDSF